MAREIVTMRVDHIGVDGLGYGHVEGYQVAVPGVAENDIVDVELERKNPNSRQASGRVVQVQARGASFVRPACHHAAPIRGQCGGCPLMHIDISAQRRYKNLRVERALEHFPGYQMQPELREAQGTNPDGLAYRNRANYHVYRPTQGKIQLGSRAFRGQGFAKMDGCLVNHPAVESVAQHVKEILNARAIPVFPARSGLRYVSIRANQQGRVLVELICAQKDPGWLHSVIPLLADHPDVHGVSLSVNRNETNAIRANPAKLVWGSDVLVENLNGLKLQLQSDTFFQLHSGVAQDMYREAARWVKPARVIWELYAGVGGLGLSVLRNQREASLFGCEYSENAVRLARKNAQENGMQAHFDVVDLSKARPKGWPPADLILVNPPRRGLDAGIRELVAKVRPKQLLYMSCSPESLHDDLKEICAQGYRIEQHAAWDMLPQTEHVEVLVLLERIAAKAPPRRPSRPNIDSETGEEIHDPAALHRRRFARKR